MVKKTEICQRIYLDVPSERGFSALMGCGIFTLLLLV